MTHDVVVVGGGIGGLTVAALLAARGVDVCLIEREWQTGGCAAPFEIMDYRFEPSAGLYPQWGPGEIHQHIFAALGLPPLQAHLREPSYVVRLPDGDDLRVERDEEVFFSSLRCVFPECAAEAVNFYRAIKAPAEALQRLALQFKYPSIFFPLGWLGLLAAEPRLTPHLWRARRETAASHLTQTSLRFRQFIDAQLLSLIAQTSADCPWLFAAYALHLSRLGFHAPRGGVASLIRTLNEALQRAGGTVRLGATALRLVYDERENRAAGVVLLTGETIDAKRAVVSNLTVRDTYDKLIGVNRTPASVRARLKHLGHSGRYLLFLALDEKATATLPAEQMIVVTDNRETTLTDAVFNLNV
ncbi:MAG TPA: FAD-dependent oxidoreductase, partial [Pyrinomonadaceae bacterium]|nr:FAD-dependent oxidoreductase [Pyrinomonadaceae bacterium]